MIQPPEVGDILSEACGRVGLTATGAEVLSSGENHVYRLHDPAAGTVIARISKPGQGRVAAREIFLGGWLNSSGVRAVQPFSGLAAEQPIVVADHPVTFWHDLGPHDPGTPVQVAATLRRLHALPVPAEMDEHQLAPFVRLDERIQFATWLDERDRRWLADRLEDLRHQWKKRPVGMPDSVIHGDAWAGNVVATGAGVTLLDLERCTVGPPEWDLTSTACRLTSYSTLSTVDYDAYCQAYGYDVTGWEGFPLFRDVRELRVTCFAAYRAQTDPALRPHALTRVASLRGLGGPRPWRWDPLP